MKAALMFSGQGSQYLGMGKEFYDNFPEVQALINEAEKVTNYPIKKILFEDEELLNNTKYTQVALFALYGAIIKVLKKYDLNINYSMGLSLGEYGAYLYNDVFDFALGLEIIKNRAILMEKAQNLNPGKMCAVIGLDLKTLEMALKDEVNSLEIANYNAYDQYVVSGSSEAILNFKDKVLTLGAKRAIVLNTSGAFHSRFMKNAEKDFGEYLKTITLNEPVKNLYINLTGNKYTEAIKEVMTKQITHGVRFYQMVENMILEGVDFFIEIGPKQTLSSLVKKINPNVEVTNIEDLVSLNKTMSKWRDRNEGK